MIFSYVFNGIFSFIGTVSDYETMDLAPLLAVRLSRRFF